jgi:hypothetical protein
MKKNHDLQIYTAVVLGLALFVGTFMVAWDATEGYRENINRPLTSNSETIKNSLK